jgi:multidrug efflux pump subunit AcrB
LFVNFFIDRPIFAGVISILIFLAGLLALRSLPVAQYPDISPPTIQLTANYPGANAPLMAETVAAPIEEQIRRGKHDLSELDQFQHRPEHAHYDVRDWHQSKPRTG